MFCIAEIFILHRSYVVNERSPKITPHSKLMRGYFRYLLRIVTVLLPLEVMKDLLGNKLVTHPRHGLNELRIGRVYLDLTAQAIDHVLEHRAIQFIGIAPNTSV